MSKRVIRIGGAALLVALTAAPGAQAQRLQAVPIVSGIPAGPPDRIAAPPVRDLFPARPGIGVANRVLSEQDGSTVTRRGLIGSVSVAPNMEAGVGLFSVTGDQRKQTEFKRNWSYRDVTPRNESIAAVGVKLKF